MTVGGGKDAGGVGEGEGDDDLSGLGFVGIGDSNLLLMAGVGVIGLSWGLGERSWDAVSGRRRVGFA